MTGPRPWISLVPEMGLEPTSLAFRARLFVGIGAVANLNSFNERVGRIVESPFPKESGD